MTNPVDDLLLSESAGLTASGVLVLDAPELAAAATTRWPAVAAYCDSLVQERTLSRPAVTLTTYVLAGIDLVLMHLPKSLAALDEYAGLIATHTRPGVRVLAGGRVKHMNRGMNEVLESHFDRVRASLGVRKARVLHAAGPQPSTDDWPRRQWYPELGLELAAYGHTFGGTKIDAGSRLLLQALQGAISPKGPGSLAVDLGCGNGTLSVAVARAGFRTLAIDESWAACRATSATAAANGVEVKVSRRDGLTGLKPGSVELIVCNPPFHIGTAKDSSTALRFFVEAGRTLATGGEFWAVWNAHLPYLPALRRSIGRTAIVARDPRYIVTRSVADGRHGHR